MSKRGVNILLGTVALMLGFSTYVIFRDSTYVGRMFSGLHFVERIRTSLVSVPINFLEFYFPDFLWGFSLGCGLLVIYKPVGRGIILCGCVAALCGYVWEMMQYLHIVSGTGDFVDIIMYSLASFFVIIINLKEKRHEKD